MPLKITTCPFFGRIMPEKWLFVKVFVNNSAEFLPDWWYRGMAYYLHPPKCTAEEVDKHDQVDEESQKLCKHRPQPVRHLILQAPAPPAKSYAVHIFKEEAIFISELRCCFQRWIRQPQRVRERICLVLIWKYWVSMINAPDELHGLENA